ncbi:MAG: anhydro-N-acetylmuramic acid kinase [Planctomycetes bacterium]|nr:anhydro-N-acetylmuramic acid kinase [Planctomycetota bacterium]
MLGELRSVFEAEGALVAGVLSGTSADGIDVALTRMRARAWRIEAPQLLAFEIEPYPEDVRARVRAVLDGAPCGLREAALLTRDLGRAFGRAARAVSERHGLALDLVASHGQTVWHHDGAEESGPATLQLGDGDCVSEACGTAVASDFRMRDIAAGGEGAPVSALADRIMFARAPRPCAVLNLGGMANLTWLGHTDDELLAFDTGPANALLDGLARRFLNAACDRDGAAARRGRADAQLIADELRHPFFAASPPKSTGRDTFGEQFVADFCRRAEARGVGRADRADLLATATELVAATVAIALARFVPRVASELWVAGGGVHNRALMGALHERCGIPVRSSAGLGIPPDAREALVFAVLGAACALEIPLSAPGATGSAPLRVLGKLSPAPGKANISTGT